MQPRRTATQTQLAKSLAKDARLAFDILMARDEKGPRHYGDFVNRLRGYDPVLWLEITSLEPPELDKLLHALYGHLPAPKRPTSRVPRPFPLVPHASSPVPRPFSNLKSQISNLRALAPFLNTLLSALIIAAFFALLYIVMAVASTDRPLWSKP